MPMQPTVKRLLGAFAPKTEEGTIYGAPITAAEAVFKKLRLGILLLTFIYDLLSGKDQYSSFFSYCTSQ